MTVTPQRLEKCENDGLEIARALDVEVLRQADALDSMAEAAAGIGRAPIAFISIVGPESQQVVGWCGKSREEIPRQRDFCDESVADEGVLIVEELGTDPRFDPGALDVLDEGIEFFAGLSLLVDDVAVGSLSLFDTRPRSIDQFRRAALFGLVHQIESHLAIHRLRDGADDARESISEHLTALAARAAMLRWDDQTESASQEQVNAIEREVEAARRALEGMFRADAIPEEGARNRIKEMEDEATRVDRSALGFIDTEVDEV